MNCSLCADAGAAKAVTPSAAAAANPTSFMLMFLSLNTGRARRARSFAVDQEAGGPALGLDVARVPAAPQYGNGHRRSFSFAVAHSRASPFGSTIRKKTIIAPNTMNSM